MRILQLGPYPPPYGGVAVHLMSLSRCLRDHGHEVLIDEVNIPKFRGGIFRYFKILKFLKRQQLSLLHVHTSSYGGFSIGIRSALASFFLRHPLIWTVHGGGFRDFYRKSSPLKKSVIRLCLRRADKIIPVSRDLEEKLREIGIPGNRISPFISPLLPLPEIKTDRSGFPPDLKNFLKSRDILLATIGFFQPEYGLDLIPAVLSEWQETTDKKVGWVIIGKKSGSGYSDFLKLLQQYKVDRDIILSGELDWKTVINLLKAVQLYVSPKHIESYGMAVAEAYLQGCVCVVSDANQSFPAGRHLLKFRDGSKESLLQTIRTARGGPGNDDRIPPDSNRLREQAENNLQHILEVYDEVIR
jgi:glycosyltransferase involved in cell wall biosynthesis